MMDLRALLKSAGLLGLSGLTSTGPPKRKNIPARERKEKRAKKSRLKMQQMGRRTNRRKR